MRARSIAASILSLIALASCGGGGGGGGGQLSQAIALVTAPYLILDLSTGTITTRTSIGDLATNPAWRSTSMVFKAVQSASDTVGSQPTDFGHQTDEVATSVSIPKYYVGVFEVTQAQWTLLGTQAPALAGLVGGATPWTLAPHQAINGVVTSVDPEKPAYGLTFQALSTVVTAWNGGHAVHLAIPSEAQWEHASRGGAKVLGANADFAWGNARDAATTVQYARLAETLNGSSGPARVGSLTANGFGLFDVHGNVWEWTQVTASTGRVRGGSWTDTLSEARCANKVDLDELTVHALVGARLVLVP
jgi:formylglycine-generating enzyme required for sulfatase activity